MAHTVAPTLARTLVLALGLGLVFATPAAAGWWDEAGGAKETTLAELRRDPEPWRDVTIVMPALFERVPERVNPFFTQFNPGSWQPLAVRARGTRDGKDIVFDRVFVRRGSELERELVKLTLGEPLLLRGVVRDTTGDEPWIEILGLTRSGDGLTPEEDARVTQADRFLAKSNPIAAEELYRTVLEARELGDAERATLRGKLGAALYAQGRLEDAGTELRAALDIDPLDRAAADRLERVTDALAAPRTAPPTARIARPAPEPPAAHDALRLPGDRPRLAPPSGLGGGIERAADRTADPAPSIPAASPAPGETTPAVPPRPAAPLAAPTSFPEVELPTPPRPRLAPPAAPFRAAPARPAGPIERPQVETPDASPHAPTSAPAARTPPAPASTPASDVAQRLPAPPRRRAAAPPAPEPAPVYRQPPPVRRSAPPAPRPVGEKPGRPLPAPKPAPVVEEEEEEPVPPIPSRPPLVGPK